MIINMVTGKQMLNIFQRTTLLFEMLQKANHRFGTAQEAYSYIKECLENIENEYASHTRWVMSIVSFQDFYFDDKYKLHYIDTLNQRIIIHQNGAYAIYQLPQDRSQVDFPFLKGGTTKIVEHTNKNNLSVWCSCI